MKTLSGIVVLILFMLVSAGTASSQDIYEAVANGDLLQVKEILLENPDLLNVKNDGELTPLNLACESGQAGIVEFLLKHGADPYIGDAENSMPIHLAAISGSIESLDLLLDHDIDIDIEDDNGMTALLFALSRRQVDMAEHLIKQGADIDVQSIIGWTPVQLAIVIRADDMAKLLIESGADLNVCVETGVTPLHTAVSYGKTDIAKLLIENGADLNAKSLQGDKALAFASNPNTRDAMILLIKNGADVNYKNDFGQTALHRVAGRGTALDNAQILLDHGAAINAQDENGRTAIFYTAWSENPDEMSKFLILNGADVNPDACMDAKTCACYPDFSTPLHAAVRHGKINLAKNLVMNGAKVNVYNDEGLTPLHCAVQNGNPELVQYLIDHGAFLNVPEQSQGSTELHLAIAMGYTDITEILMEKGADPNLTDNSGKTPFDYAMYYNHKPLGYELLAEGADDTKLSEYLSCPDELSVDIGYGEAKVWFLGHSGWAVKTQNHFLVIDYFCNTWDRKADDSCLASGCIIPDQLKDMNVTVFSTHSHGDHYDPRIFNWKESIPDIEYVLCWEQNTEGNEYTYVPIHEEKEIEDMNVYAHYSTDLGGGYLIEVDGLKILHMGDHANGEDDLMAAYTDEIDILAQRTDEIDILFAGIRGCSLGEPQQVKQGIYYTLENLQPKLFVPMHAGAHSFAYKSFVEQAQNDGFEMDMQYVIHKGDRFTYVKDGVEVTASK